MKPTWVPPGAAVWPVWCKGIITNSSNDWNFNFHSHSLSLEVLNCTKVLSKVSSFSCLGLAQDSFLPRGTPFRAVDTSPCLKNPWLGITQRSQWKPTWPQQLPNWHLVCLCFSLGPKSPRCTQEPSQGELCMEVEQERFSPSTRTSQPCQSIYEQLLSPQMAASTAKITSLRQGQILRASIKVIQGTPFSLQSNQKHLWPIICSANTTQTLPVLTNIFFHHCSIAVCPV